MSTVESRAGTERLPITVLIATRNEQANIGRCLSALSPARRIVVIDSNSTDGTAAIAQSHGAEVVQFSYMGGHPKKRQWALDTLSLDTAWVMLLDADEVVPEALWEEISAALSSHRPCDAYLISKGFHFMGRRFRFGGFSHAAIVLFRCGTARFEELLDDTMDALDMEVHERLIVAGTIGRLATPLIHEDFKGLEAYIARHNSYSTWEARIRDNFLTTGAYGSQVVDASILGNTQERRRALKKIAMRAPFEHWFWFCYHYVLRLGFLEGRRGLIACRLRCAYISQVRAKVFELSLRRRSGE